MLFSLNPLLLALSIAGFAIILPTTTIASPVRTHIPIPIPISFPNPTAASSPFLPTAPLSTAPLPTILGTSVNATSSTSLIPTTTTTTTTTTIHGIPLHPSTVTAHVPTIRPNGGGSGCNPGFPGGSNQFKRHNVGCLAW